VALALGLCAARRAPARVVAAGIGVAVAGVAAGPVAPVAFLATPLATLAIGVSPAVPRTLACRGRALLVALLTAAGASFAAAMLPGPAVLVVVPLAMVIFVVAVAAEVRAEMSGLITGAGLLGALVGALPALALAVLALAAFPALAGRSTRTAAS